MLSTSQHFVGKGACWSSGMGLGRTTSSSLIHTNLHKPNNKLVIAESKQLGARTSHKQTQTYKTHHNPDLGETTTFPLIVLFVPSHYTCTQCHFVPRLPLGSPKIPKSGTPMTLEAYNFACRHLIEVKFQAKL